MNINEEYNKGIQIGELIGEIKALNSMLETHIEKQEKCNEDINKRLSIAEQWIQTTTGKVVILTAIFSVVGSVCYIIINWLLAKYKV